MAAVAKLEQAAAVEVSKAMTNAEKAAALLRQRGIAIPDGAFGSLPSVGTIARAKARPFDWEGEDYKPDVLDYRRAVTPDDVSAFAAEGFVPAKGLKVRMIGCHTHDETIMVRTREAADRFHAAERDEVERRTTGRKQETGQHGLATMTTNTTKMQLGDTPG